jgi:hypothetical protein
VGLFDFRNHDDTVLNLRHSDLSTIHEVYSACKSKIPLVALGNQKERAHLPI